MFSYEHGWFSSLPRKKFFRRVTTNLGQMGKIAFVLVNSLVSPWSQLASKPWGILWQPWRRQDWNGPTWIILGVPSGYVKGWEDVGRMLGGCWEDGFELSVWCYPLVMSKLLKMAIETVHLPIRHGGSFQYPQRETFTIYPRAQDSPGVGLSWRHRVYCLHMGTWPNNVPTGYIQLVLSQEKRTIL